MNGEWVRSDNIEEDLFVITAWNPMGQLTSDEENSKSNMLLKYDLLEISDVIYPAIGRNPNGPWQEEGFAVVDISLSQAKDLGAKYRQIAIFRISNSTKELISTEN